MVKLELGYLFKKEYITYKNQKIEIFIFIDYVCGFRFNNKEGNILCNIISGNYVGIYASSIGKDANEKEYVFIGTDTNKIILENNNIVDFKKIREMKLANMTKYYVRNEKNNGVKDLKDKDLISYLERNNEKKKSDFDEEEFDQGTDISNMYSSIKKTIVSQDEQIMQILTSLFKNQKVINASLDGELIAKLKENILIYGPTGTGKTEILKRISKLYKVPIVIEDATSLSETGYEGRKITDMLEDLYLAADSDIEKAEKGILVIDEFDKLAEKEGDSQSHVSRLGVQRSLLKLLDGTLYYFDNKKFDTSKLTIVGLGAFSGITTSDNYQHLTTQDFIKYGIMRELLGRFSKTIHMNSLKKNDIIKILKESNFSPLNTYKKLFEILDVDFTFNDEFIEYIAELAVAKNSGARSLKTVFDECISSALFRIFAGEYSSISLIKPNDENNKPYILTKKINRK